jgi:hypothetical protein
MPEQKVPYGRQALGLVLDVFKAQIGLRFRRQAVL